MSHKLEQNTSIKNYLLGSDNQHNKTKTKSTEHTNNKLATITKTITMNKEGSTSSKAKTPKLNKGDKSMIDEPTGKPSQQRDASTRSPLDGNPEKKKQKDNRRSISDETYHDDPNDKNDAITNKDSTGNTISPIEKTTDANGKDTVQLESDSKCHEETNSLLKELIEIKNSISGLNDKVDLNHQELTSKLADSIEMKEIIFSHNEKIDQLNKENTELRSSNRQLEKDILQLQETCYTLK